MVTLSPSLKKALYINTFMVAFKSNFLRLSPVWTLENELSYLSIHSKNLYDS